MIGLFLEENKIRFEINLASAEHAKLKLSSRLLTLAKTVLGGSRVN
jgi:YfiR/HmsC-like